MEEWARVRGRLLTRMRGGRETEDPERGRSRNMRKKNCLLYTSDAADE